MTAHFKTIIRTLGSAVLLGAVSFNVFSVCLVWLFFLWLWPCFGNVQLFRWFQLWHRVRGSRLHYYYFLRCSNDFDFDGCNWATFQRNAVLQLPRQKSLASMSWAVEKSDDDNTILEFISALVQLTGPRRYCSEFGNLWFGSFMHLWLAVTTWIGFRTAKGGLTLISTFYLMT